MTVKKIYVVIIVLAVVGIVVGIYFVAIKRVDNTAQTVQDVQDGHVATTGSVTPTRKELTREELVAADWPMNWKSVGLSQNWKRFGDYEIKFDTNVFPDVISVRKVGDQQEITKFSSDVFISPTPGRVARNERRENTSGAEIIANPQLGKLYAFFAFGNSHGGGFRKVYESDFFGRSAHEFEPNQGDEDTGYGHAESYRYSPDYTRLNYVTNEAGKIYFHILDLFDSKQSVKFAMPSLPLRIGATSSDKNWIAAWRFADENTIEFTRYRASGNDADGYTQISDKELWNYNIPIKKLTLLEIIPFKK